MIPDCPARGKDIPHKEQITRNNDIFLILTFNWIRKLTEFLQESHNVSMLAKGILVL